ncbi:MAG: response regulator [Gammaproteobacteria bacterium]|nr:MAG: response regulator [Gammaproteobacteria bacterium]
MEMAMYSNVDNQDTSQVLIVDDDPDQSRYQQQILQAPRYQTHVVDSGEAALNILSEIPFDVMLLDRKMPGMDGHKVCRLAGDVKLNHSMSIIMVTASRGSNVIEESFRAGATDFIRKPYDRWELLARVDAAVERSRMMSQLDNAESLLCALARIIEAKDEGTGEHCGRLAHTAVVFGKALGLPGIEITALRRGGILHDLGKLAIPDSILLKQGSLDDQEWQLMRQHTVIGARLLSGLDSMKLTVDIVRHHHERWNGSGYPDGLRGTDIPRLARIFQIVDVFDALMHKRPYKSAMSQEGVMQKMLEEASAGLLDPGLTQVFLGLLHSQPNSLIHGGKDQLPGAGLYEDVMASGVMDWDMRAMG